jgi:hypothetical protein
VGKDSERSIGGNFRAFARTALAHHAANGKRRTGAALVQQKERLSLDCLFVCLFA